MKKIYLKSVAFLACAAVMTGCGENSWNDHLDGFEEPPVYPDTEAIKYELTAADYNTIAGLSANKALATTDEEKAALSAIGTNRCFTSEEQARKYLPAFFANSGFPYFTLNDGSSINVTYVVSQAVLPEVTAINKGVAEVKVDEADYIEAWGSDEDYIKAFAPITPASASLPSILKAKLADATEGDYAVISYAEADANPVFGGSSSVPQVYIEQSFAEGYDGFTIDNVLLPEGSSYVWSHDANYSCMKASGYVNKQNLDSESWLVSSEVTLSENANAILTFDQAVQYFASVDAAKDEASVNVREKGGNWVKLDIPNYPEKLSWSFVASGDIDLSAYNGKTIQIGFCYKSTTAKAGTWEVNNVKLADGGATRSLQTRAPLAEVASVNKVAFYQYKDGAWSVPSATAILQPADYTAMGQKYGNLSNNLPAELIPAYLNANYPYAAEDDSKVVVYKYYDSNKVTSFKAMDFVFADGKWGVNSYKETVTEQYNKLKGTWAFDPSVVLTLPAGKGIAISSTYYQACVDWVYENIDIPLGSTSIKSGIGYVTTYGNNEYYSGTSAYQNNVDLRASAARGQYAKGYEGMTDEQVVETMKTRFVKEVMPGALSKLYPDTKPIDGLEVLFTINFSAYSGSSTDAYTAVWKVVGPAKFEFVSCTWWESGKPAE